MTPETLFYEYIADWIRTYKEGAIRPVSVVKYWCAHGHVMRLAPDLTLKNINKRAYQQLINRYAETHTKSTTTEFHNCIRAPLLEAVEEGLVIADPTKRIVLKGRPHEKNVKYLSLAEAEKLAAALELRPPIIVERDKLVKGQRYAYETNMDWLIFLCLNTGARLSEALAVTPADFDFAGRTLALTKTFDYKIDYGITNNMKSRSSKRHIAIDSHLADKFSRALIGASPDNSIFVPPGQRFHTSDSTRRINQLCEKLDIPKVGIHGLRHTHASILLYGGVSVHAISRRLGHAKVSITQDVYLHIIKELEAKDTDIITNVLEGMYFKIRH